MIDSNNNHYWFYVGLYLVFNLALTLYNKHVLDNFPYPYTLTAVHSLCNVIGCTIARFKGYYSTTKLSKSEIITLVFFSTLYTFNIAVSNLSLNLVSVPVHQIIRSIGPLFTMFLAVPLLNSKFSFEKFISLIPIMIGIALTTYGDIIYTKVGLVMTFLGTFLASLKTVITNLMQNGFKHEQNQSKFQMHPLDLLFRLSPLAFVQCVGYIIYSEEYFEVYKDLWPMPHVWKTILLIAFNGAIAFGLNVVSFTTNKNVGPLTISVAANIKQVLAILLSFLFFDLNITLISFTGIVVAVVGGFCYGRIEYKEKLSSYRKIPT